VRVIIDAKKKTFSLHHQGRKEGVNFAENNDEGSGWVVYKNKGEGESEKGNVKVQGWSLKEGLP